MRTYPLTVGQQFGQRLDTEAATSTSATVAAVRIRQCGALSRRCRGQHRSTYSANVAYAQGQHPQRIGGGRAVHHQVVPPA